MRVSVLFCSIIFYLKEIKTFSVVLVYLICVNNSEFITNNLFLIMNALLMMKQRSTSVDVHSTTRTFAICILLENYINACESTCSQRCIKIFQINLKTSKKITSLLNIQPVKWPPQNTYVYRCIEVFCTQPWTCSAVTCNHLCNSCQLYTLIFLKLFIFILVDTM